METWNNVELADLSKKSYTLNHDYDTVRKVIVNHNNNEEVVVDPSVPTEGQQAANGDGTLQPGSDIKPKVKAEDVESLLRRLYGITIAEIKELISYDDRNYFLKEDLNIKNPLIPTHCPHGYVLKILNSLDSKKTDFVDAQNQLMIYLAKEGIQCPRPIANVNGKHYSVEFINGAHYVVRLLEYVPGKIFHEVEATNYLLYQSGEFLANIDRSLKHFNHVAYDTHKSTWQLQAVPKLSEFMYVIKDHARKTLCEEIIAAFEENVLSELDQLPQQIIHGDFNEQNVVVNPKSSGGSSAEYRVTGIIDFGDTNKSPLIFEIAIAMTYMMLQAKSLVGGGIFLAGYTLNNPITQEEKGFLKYCIAARLAQSLIMGAYTHSLDPTNDYVLATQDEGWKLINELWREQFENVDEMWQMAGDKYLTQSVK